MSPWIEALFAKYGAVAIGILFGTSAKYAMAMVEGRKLTTRMVIIDALLIGMVALIASETVARMGATGGTAAMVAALFAVSSDRVIRLIRENFIRRFDAELKSQVAQHIGEVRQEVQAELSGQAVIDDTLNGRAPEEYEALKPHIAPRYPTDEKEV